jgi:sulfide dehydrogenase cytochrome subunit
MKAIARGLLLAAVAAAAAAQAGEDLEGFELASHCMACHGPAGRSPGAIPALNGRDRAFIVERLRAFRDGTRPSTVMGRLAKGYTDEEIARIADYIAGLGEVP